MDYCIHSKIPERKRAAYAALLQACSLQDECDADLTILAEDDEGEIIGSVSLKGNVLKQLAVSPTAESGGLAAGMISQLKQEAANRGESKLFMYTKPMHKRMMESMGFYSFFETEDVLMMESRKNGFSDFLKTTSEAIGCTTDGAVVCNCNPFTLGHRHLIEYAASNCRELAVFVLSEDKSFFPAEARFRLVKEGVSHLKNVHVIRSGDYLISRATFPMYFIKDQTRTEDIRADLDLLLFSGPIAKAFGITRRFVGQEPFDPVTRAYNARMKQLLPKQGIEVTEIPRFEEISASRVRKLIGQGEWEQIKELVPKTTFDYCIKHFG